MSALDQIVQVIISQNTAAVSQVSFSIPLIIGPTAIPTATYNDPDGMLDAGYVSTDPEYVYALEMFQQPLTPTQFVVGPRLPAVAQVDTFAVNTVTVGNVYEFTLNGEVINYTAILGDAEEDILAGLLADIAVEFPTSPPVTGVVTGVGPAALLTLTSTEAGLPVTYGVIDPLLTHVLVTANYGISDDLAAIIDVNDTWYGAVLCSNTDADIRQLAAAIEPLKKIFVAASGNANIGTAITTDLLSFLKGKSYKRTALIWSELSFNLGIDAAWVGGQLPFTPGSNNWAFKTLVGISPDDISDNEAAIVIGNPVEQIAGKNGNIYRTIGGQNITQMGQMVGGQYIDITVGIDWLQATIQTNIYRELVTAAKIPYTDKGVAILISAVQSAIDQGIVNGLIDGDSPISVTAPPVLSVPINQRAGRVAPTITFTCRLQGAINAVKVQGTVTV